MKTIVTLVILVAILGLGGYAYIQAGLYDVSAAGPRGGLFDDIARAGLRPFGRAPRPGHPGAPPGRSGAAQNGIAHYQEMCVTCHGAPGVERSEIGAGLNPGPPNLVRSARHMSPAEVYWIVKNGVKMTGMPAFGPNHNETALWAITAFVKQLPDLSPEQYQALAKSAGPAEEHEHDHDHEPPAPGAAGAGH